jgi:hypothetical protein
MLNDSSESDSSSSNENDLDLVLIDYMFPNKKPSVPLLNLEDLSDWQCEKMFR